MFWEDTKEEKLVEKPKTVLLSFSIDINCLPVDHIYDLSKVILHKVPYLKEKQNVGIHEIYGAESGNGWERPKNNEDIIYPSRRTRFNLQLPRNLVLQVSEDLDNFQVDLLGNKLMLGNPKAREVLRHHTIFSRGVVSFADSENRFLEQTRGILTDMGISAKKMICGTSGFIKTPEGGLKTRRLMLADLNLRDSELLQSCGIGDYKLLGCGLFLPHKVVEDTYTKMDSDYI